MDEVTDVPSTNPAVKYTFWMCLVLTTIEILLLKMALIKEVGLHLGSVSVHRLDKMDEVKHL